MMKVRKMIQNQMDIRKVLPAKEKEILRKDARMRMEVSHLFDGDQEDFHK